MLKSMRVMLGLVLTLACGLFISAGGAAAEVSNPQEVVQSYLNGLANGNTSLLAELIDGSMKEKSYRLLTENPDYPKFLRTQYAGVVMTIEEVTRASDDYNALVRFDYPTSDSTTTRFTLRFIDGKWKIINEEPL